MQFAVADLDDTLITLEHSSTVLNPNTNKAHTCYQCGKSFTRPCRLKQHNMTVHMGLKPWTCDSCGRKFGLKENLKRHFLICHVNNT